MNICAYCQFLLLTSKEPKQFIQMCTFTCMYHMSPQDYEAIATENIFFISLFVTHF